MKTGCVGGWPDNAMYALLTENNAPPKYMTIYHFFTTDFPTQCLAEGIAESYFSHGELKDVVYVILLSVVNENSSVEFNLLTLLFHMSPHSRTVGPLIIFTIAITLYLCSCFSIPIHQKDPLGL
jgi:hypothetical protein